MAFWRPRKAVTAPLHQTHPERSKHLHSLTLPVKQRTISYIAQQVKQLIVAGRIPVITWSIGYIYIYRSKVLSKLLHSGHCLSFSHRSTHRGKASWQRRSIGTRSGKVPSPDHWWSNPNCRVVIISTSSKTLNALCLSWCRWNIFQAFIILHLDYHQKDWISFFMERFSTHPLSVTSKLDDACLHYGEHSYVYFMATSWNTATLFQLFQGIQSIEQAGRKYLGEFS